MSARYRLASAAVLLLAFALRVGGLGAQELRGDEAFGYFFQQRGYQEMIVATLALDEPHPVGSYFLQKPWQAVAGASEFALRFPSAWFSVLAVALIERVARRLGLAHRTGLLAALLLAAGPYAIWHAQDARMYSMSLALNTAVVWLAIEALARRRPVWIAAYIGAALLALHTHYFSAFTLIALSLFVLGRALAAPSARRAVLDWLSWNVLLALLYMPWLGAAEGILSGYVGNGDSPGFVEMARRALSVFAVGEATPEPQRALWALLAALLLLLGSARLWASGAGGRRTLWLLACWGGVPLLLTWIGALERPIFNERYLVAALPAFLLLIAAASEPLRAPRRWMDALAALLLVALAVGMGAGFVRHHTDPAYSKTRGWRSLAAQMERWAAGLPPAQTRLAQTYPDPTLWYYTGDVAHLVLPPAAGDAAGAAREVDALLAAGVERVVLAVQPAEAWNLGGMAQAALEEGFDRARAAPAGGWTLELYARTPSTMAVHPPAPEAALALAAQAIQPQEPIPGAALVAHLLWQAGPDALSGSEVVSVQLLGPDGALVAQDDRPLAPAGPEGSTLQAYGILLPDVLLPGDYRLIAVVYDPSREGAPRLPLVGGADHVELARWRLPAPAGS